MNLEKSRQSKKVLSSLKVDGETIHNNEEILMEEVNFYRKLYTTENVDSSSITTYLSNINDITKLNVNNANLCGGTLSEEECKCAIKEMNKNKSPGHDGLTAEFYQMFWSKISKLLIYSFQLPRNTVFCHYYIKRGTQKTSKIGDRFLYITLIIKWLQKFG